MTFISDPVESHWNFANDLVISVLSDLNENFERPSENIIQALEHLRNTYKSSWKNSPDFSKEHVRRAYLYAYHPHHLTASEIIAEKVHSEIEDIFGKDKLNAIDLGCGAGAGSIGISSFRRRIYKDKIPPIAWTFLDLHHGWFDLLKKQARNLSGDYLHCSPEDFVVVNFNNNSGLKAAKADLENADLLISQTLLTELNDAGIRNFTNLVSQAKAGTYLILSDFDKVSAGNNHYLKSFKKAGGDEAYELVYSSERMHKRLPKPPIKFRALLDSSDNRIPKRNLHFSFAVYKRKICSNKE